MEFKLSFGDYSTLKKKILGMKQKDLSRWIRSIYQSGYLDGYNTCEKPECPDDVMDWILVKTAIRATEGLSKKQKEMVISTVEKLCFSEETSMKGVRK